jgi:aminomethyltransferase
MLQRTPLYPQHQALHATLVDFSGFEMPIHYGSQIEEHHQVRRDAGMFDVSHMVVTDLTGPQALDFLRYLLANDVAKLKNMGRAIYSCMLNEQGGVIDDLIVYWLAENEYRLVTNAGTRDKDWAWLQQQQQSFSVVLTPRPELAILAVQGPNARAKVAETQSPEIAEAILALAPFSCARFGELFFGRTGYTGEDGFEIILPATDVAALWETLLMLGVKPCGLGARDTLRLEAGMNLYGQDMDETTSPLTSNLAWTVAMEPSNRRFIGRAVLETQLAHGVPERLVGLVLSARGVLRHHQMVVVDGIGEGVVTSGTFSPTLGVAIAFARVPSQTGEQCDVMIRDKRVPAKVVKPVFVRHGKSMI